MNSKVFAVDFETFYDSKSGYSLTEMSSYAYTRDPRFDPYLVSVVGEDGTEFSGSPLTFDWSSVAGATLVMHNAAFDSTVLERLMELGSVPRFEYTLFDTADMVAFMCAPRSLKGACKHLLGIEVDKQRRSDMNGKRWADLPQEDREGMTKYALDDSRLALQLYTRFHGQWPAWEQAVSALNRTSATVGVKIDRALVRSGLETLLKKRDDVAKELPWVAKGKKASSRPEFLMHVEALGLPVPKSIKKDDPYMIDWVKRYSPHYPFIQARMVAASLGGHISRLQGMLLRADENDMMRFESKYYGAHTGRCSGKGNDDDDDSAKVNMFNIPKGDRHGLTHGVDMRGTLIPESGRAFVIFDYSQIEARIVQWLAGNVRFLAMVERENIYQAAAKHMGWCNPDETDLKRNSKKTYAMAKAATLGLGFSMGASKFVGSAEQQGAKLTATPREEWVLDRRSKFILRNVAKLDWNNPANDEAIGMFFTADKIVQQWRSANSQVVELWGKVEGALREAALRNAPVHNFELPSGRVKPYWRPKVSARPKIALDAETGEAKTVIDRALTASLILGDLPDFLHGGVITENLVQAIARDIMFHGALAVQRHSKSWRYVLNVYDELIFSVPYSDRLEASSTVPYLLCRDESLAWTKGLPLGVEGGWSMKYEKENDQNWSAWPKEGGW